MIVDSAWYLNGERRPVELTKEGLDEVARSGGFAWIGMHEPSLDEMQAQNDLGQFSHLGQYQEWLPLNIQGMHRQVSLHRRGN